ncbi:MAG: patatin-like phospholipase family protein [Gemmatimonadales bacterium]|nr:patatin-like phospholipase family protein [Gemmatimonadales bacterium]
MPRIALVLGGGGARGLAHIGVLDVLARAGIPVHFIAGTSMGGLIGGLHASGLPTAEMVAVARRFRFPRWFLPGGLLEWASLFPSVPAHLAETFEDLSPPLAIAALDLEEGAQVVLHRGPVLPAVRATCAVPGILAPVRLNGRWLVDGGVVNGLPTDVAWIANPDIVIAVRVGAPRIRRIPQLQWRVTSMVSRLGRFLPNPATAKMSLEVLTRTAEVMLERQTALTAAMADPEILIEPELGDIGLRDFQRLDEAVAAGRRAAAEALPGIEYLLASVRHSGVSEARSVSLHFDPVCGMAVSPTRARASRAHDGTTFYFCSPNCLDCFVRAPARYLGQARLAFQAPAGG